MSKELIGEWLKPYGVEGFRGKATFDYEHETQFTVELTNDERYLMLSSVIEQVSAIATREHLHQILRLNHLGIETRGGTLSIDETGENLVLWYSRPVAALDPEGFDNLIGSFLDVTRHIQQKVSAPASDPEPAPARGPLVRV